ESNEGRVRDDARRLPAEPRSAHHPAPDAVLLTGGRRDVRVKSERLAVYTRWGGKCARWWGDDCQRRDQHPFDEWEQLGTDDWETADWNVGACRTRRRLDEGLVQRRQNRGHLIRYHVLRPNAVVAGVNFIVPRARTADCESGARV